MKILVFDTCFNKSYIVLRDKDNIIDSRIIESTQDNYHSAYLISQIRDILRKNNLKITDLNAIGVNIGPASFTGIRVGITIARVLAQCANLKLIGINAHKVLSKINTTDKRTYVITDARKNKVYFSEFSTDIFYETPVLIDIDELIINIKTDSIIISDSSINNFLCENGVDSINYELSDYNIGLYLSEKTIEVLNNTNDDCHWAKLKPLYIQQPSISKPKQLV
jgi:tRNA threonylcarbamoyl adenosine modification protein YeaZ